MKFNSPTVKLRFLKANELDCIAGLRSRNCSKILDLAGLQGDGGKVFRRHQPSPHSNQPRSGECEPCTFRLRQKSLAANVTVFMFMTTKDEDA
jgi:hypothetical protein